MPRGTRRLQVNRQQKNILLLALFLLKHKHKRNAPEKKQVLKFIDLQKLMAIHDADREVVATGEMAWENDIAWRRADLKDEGLLSMPFRGAWQITELGEDRLLDWVVILHYFATTNDNWEGRLEGFADFWGEEKVVITNDTVRAAQEAYQIALEKFPHRIPTISEETKGKIRL